MNEERRGRRRRWRWCWCWKCGADHVSGGSHRGSNLRGPNNAAHSAPKKENLSSRIQCLILGDVFGDMSIAGIGPTGNDDEAWVSV